MREHFNDLKMDVHNPNSLLPVTQFVRFNSIAPTEVMSASRFMKYGLNLFFIFTLLYTSLVYTCSYPRTKEMELKTNNVRLQGCVN